MHKTHFLKNPDHIIHFQKFYFSDLQGTFRVFCRWGTLFFFSAISTTVLPLKLIDSGEAVSGINFNEVTIGIKILAASLGLGLSFVSVTLWDFLFLKFIKWKYNATSIFLYVTHFTISIPFVRLFDPYLRLIARTVGLKYNDGKIYDNRTGKRLMLRPS